MGARFDEAHLRSLGIGHLLEVCEQVALAQVAAVLGIVAEALDPLGVMGDEHLLDAAGLAEGDCLVGLALRVERVGLGDGDDAAAELLVGHGQKQRRVHAAREAHRNGAQAFEVRPQGLKLGVLFVRCDEICHGLSFCSRIGCAQFSIFAQKG